MTSRQRALAALDEYLAAAPNLPNVRRGRKRSALEVAREERALRELAVALNARLS